MIAAQQQVLDAERLLAGPAVPQVPGLAAHAAAEAQVIAVVRVGDQNFSDRSDPGNLGPYYR